MGSQLPQPSLRALSPESFCDSLLRFKELLYHSLPLAELDRALTQVLDCHPSVSTICLTVHARHGMHTTLVTISLLLLFYTIVYCVFSVVSVYVSMFTAKLQGDWGSVLVLD